MLTDEESSAVYSAVLAFRNINDLGLPSQYETESAKRWFWMIKDAKTKLTEELEELREKRGYLEEPSREEVLMEMQLASAEFSYKVVMEGLAFISFEGDNVFLSPREDQNDPE